MDPPIHPPVPSSDRWRVPSGRVRPRRTSVWSGVGLALLGHLVISAPTLAAFVAAARAGEDALMLAFIEGTFIWMFVLACLGGLQMALAAACLIPSLADIDRRKGGMATGLLLGWASGMGVLIVSCLTGAALA